MHWKLPGPLRKFGRKRDSTVHEGHVYGWGPGSNDLLILKFIYLFEREGARVSAGPGTERGRESLKLTSY